MSPRGAGLFAISLAFTGLVGCSSTDTALPIASGGGSAGADASPDTGLGGSGGSAGAAGQSGTGATSGAGGTGGSWDLPAVEAAFQAEYSNQAATIAVLLDGKLAWTSARGYVKPGDAQAVDVTPKTNFQMNMIGQALTALGALRLVDAGSLQLDDLVKTHIPELAVGKGNEWVPSMTLRHLLTGSVGFPLKWTLPAQWQGSGDNLLNDYVAAADFSTNEKLLFPPGKLEFWNLRSASVVGLVEERASGKSYRQFMKDEVFGPLGMTRTFLTADEVMADGDYATDNLLNDHFTDSAVTRPNGYGFSNVEDLAKFAEFLLNGNEQFLPNALRNEMLSPQVATDYDPHSSTTMSLDSFWVTHGKMTFLQQSVHYHPYDFDIVWVVSGYDPYYSSMFLIPSKGFAMIILSNTAASGHSTFDTALHALLGVELLPEATDKDDDATLASYVGTYKTIDDTLVEVVKDSAGLHLNMGFVKTCLLEPSYPHTFRCLGMFQWPVVAFGMDTNNKPEYIHAETFVAMRVPPGDAGTDAD